MTNRNDGMAAIKVKILCVVVVPNMTTKTFGDINIK